MTLTNGVFVGVCATTLPRWLEHGFAYQLPNPASGPGVREETGLRYKVNGSADMTDLPLVRA